MHRSKEHLVLRGVVITGLLIGLVGVLNHVAADSQAQRGYADLVVKDSLVCVDPALTLGNPLHVQVTIENRGTKTAPPNRTGVIYQDTALTSIPTPGLLPGESTTVQTTYQPGTEGVIFSAGAEYQTVADSGNTVDEGPIGERNNTGEIKSTKDCPPGIPSRLYRAFLPLVRNMTR